MNNIKETIIDKIKAGEVSMQPRWHFVLKTILMLVSVVLVGIIAVYLLSFVMFVFHKTGISFATEFGLRGLTFAVVSSPWLIISLALAFVLLLYILVTQYAFSYRKPFVFTMLGVAAFVLIVSSAIQMTTFHNRVGKFADDRGIPGIAPFYRAIDGGRPEGMHVGTISEVSDDGFKMKDEDGTEWTVSITDDTRQRPGTVYAVEDKVIVFGDADGQTITAFGIKIAPDDFEMRKPTNDQRGGRMAPPPDGDTNNRTMPPSFERGDAPQPIGEPDEKLPTTN